MHFRWNFYEYSGGKLHLLLPGTRTDFSLLNWLESVSSGCCIKTVVGPDHRPIPAGLIKAYRPVIFMLGETL